MNDRLATPGSRAEILDRIGQIKPTLRQTPATPATPATPKRSVKRLSHAHAAMIAARLDDALTYLEVPDGWNLGDPIEAQFQAGWSARRLAQAMSFPCSAGSVRYLLKDLKITIRPAEPVPRLKVRDVADLVAALDAKVEFLEARIDAFEDQRPAPADLEGN